MTITPPIGHYVDIPTADIIRNDGKIRYTLPELYAHSEAGTGPYDPTSYYDEPIAEIYGGKTYWRYRNGGYHRGDDTYGRCGTRVEAESIISRMNVIALAQMGRGGASLAGKAPKLHDAPQTG